MHQYSSCATLAFGVVLIILASSTTSSVAAARIPVIVCPPNSMSTDASGAVRCYALLDKSELTLEEAAGDVAAAAAAAGIDPAVAQAGQIYGRGAKRQDVDHVFLRFGRRSGL